MLLLIQKKVIQLLLLMMTDKNTNLNGVISEHSLVSLPLYFQEDYIAQQR